MRRRSMFTVMIAKSLKNRWGRLWVAILAVTVGATLTSSLLTVSMGVEGVVGRELRGYGANILVTPRASIIQVGSGELGFGTVTEEKFIAEEGLDEIRSVVPKESLMGYLPYLFVPVHMGSDTVVFAGTWPDEIRRVSPWWKVEGSWVDDRSSLTEVMIGRVLAEKIEARTGDRLTISHRGHLIDTKVVGIVSTGGPDEHQIVGTLGLAQSLIEKPNVVHLVWVSVLAQGKDLERLAETIEARMRNADVKTIGQVAQAEELVLTKMNLVMTLVASLVLTTSGLGVMSTMSTSVMERRREIGLLKALGAEDRRISLLHFAEALIIGFAGGTLGYILGSAFAILIGFEVYGKVLPLQPMIFPTTIVLSLGVALLASIIPVRHALRVEEAVVLRGE